MSTKTAAEGGSQLTWRLMLARCTAYLKGTSKLQRCLILAIVIISLAPISWALYPMFVPAEPVQLEMATQTEEIPQAEVTTQSSRMRTVDETVVEDIFPWMQNWLSVHRYVIQIFFYPDRQMLIGEVAIYFSLKNSTTVIALHNNGLNCTKMQLHRMLPRGVEQSINMKLYTNESWQFSSIQATSVMETGEYRLSVQYHGPLQLVKGGEVGERCDPNLARELFPCFDNPRYTAPFNVSVDGKGFKMLFKGEWMTTCEAALHINRKFVGSEI